MWKDWLQLLELIGIELLVVIFGLIVSLVFPVLNCCVEPTVYRYSQVCKGIQHWKASFVKKHALVEVQTIFQQTLVE